MGAGDGVCQKCGEGTVPEELRSLNGRILCEDCFIDALAPKTLKVAYGSDPADFMRRLKESFSVIRQEID